MPVFEYECEQCKKKFEAKEKSVCPQCKSEKVKKLVSAFTFVMKI